MSYNVAGENAVSRSSSYQTSISSSDYKKAMTGDAVLSGGIATLYYFMDVLSQQSNQLFDEMQKKAAISSDAQGMANYVDADIAAAAADGGDKGKILLNTDVYNYMYTNHISVNGIPIDQYVKASGNKNGQLNQGQLQAVKASLETVSNQASDYVSQSQLQIQKVMQTYNVTVSLINSMQTLLADMNKSIAQNIR